MAAASWKAKIILGTAVALKKADHYDTAQLGGLPHEAKIFSFPNPINKAAVVDMALKRPLCNYAGSIKELQAGDTLTGNTLVSREVPGGTVDGNNTSFTLSSTPVIGSEQLYQNGILKNVGAGNDYTISGLTITMVTAPVPTDVLLVTYWK